MTRQKPHTVKGVCSTHGNVKAQPTWDGNGKRIALHCRQCGLPATPRPRNRRKPATKAKTPTQPKAQVEGETGTPQDGAK